MNEIVAPSDVGVDFHCGSDDRSNLPQVRGDLEDKDTVTLMRAFAAPVSLSGRPPKGSLRAQAVKLGKRVVLFEGGEARRFTPESIDSGVKGTLRLLHHLEVIDERPPDPTYEPVACDGNRWVRASEAGMFRAEVDLGAVVHKGQVLGSISDSFGERHRYVKSAKPAVVIGLRRNPLVNRGDAVAHLATPIHPPPPARQEG